MMTFSVNDGLSTEAVSYPVQDYLNDILTTLEDNQSKKIDPHEIRDAIFSLWTSVPFKQTVASGSSISYVGLDAINPIDRDIKSKILLGKRAFSGTYSYSSSHDIMIPMYTSDVDTFLFNTKKDSLSQNVTRVVIIAGTAVGIFNNSPYIQSQILSTSTQSLSFDFVNRSGSIDVKSDWGTVSLNSIAFPSLVENSASASNNKVLKWNDIDSKLYWDDISLPLVSDLGTSSSMLNIYGSPVNINGYSADFTDSRRCPITIGDIVPGSTFDGIGISEMLRRIIYTYLPPACSISILPPYSYGYVEVGTYPTPTIEYVINKKTLDTLTTGLSNMIPGAYAPITNAEYVTVMTQSQGIVISPITATSTEFKITVSDGVETASASTTLTGIYPYFYGFSDLSVMTNIGLGSLTKKVEYKSDKTYDITGAGNLYFIYPADYGTLSNIYDELGNTCSASFSYTTQLFSSPSGLWASEEFYVYQWNSVPQIGPPSVNYQFKY